MNADQLTNRGLISAYLLDGHGGGRSVTWEDIEAWDASAGTLWLHMEGDSAFTDQWLREKSGLEETVCDILTREDVRPRSIPSGEGFLTVLRGINLNEGDDPEDMVSIRIYIDAHRIITTRLRFVRSIDDLRLALGAGHGPTTPGEFLAILGERLVERMMDLIENITDEVEDLEEAVVSGHHGDVSDRLAKVRRQIVALRRHLAPQREALGLILGMDSLLLQDEDRRHLVEVLDRTIHYLEELGSARDRASVTQEEINNYMSKQVERRMYVLAVVAAIFLPLMFLTGLLGINVGGIPGGQSPWGFLSVTTILVGVFSLQIVLFRKLRWL
ncbi:MAG: zinc transporter ZntB [Fidelibacterota bacterium]|nr:MAG: zinc transporter ZntB [Candidatus Neomarinimicrobiota bacterium]